MSKPIYLREETWLFILQKLANLPGKTEAVLSSIGYVLPLQDNVKDEDFLHLIAEQPGPFLLHAGICKYPSLLYGTLIELQDGGEYIITHKAAQSLQNEETVIVLQDAYSKKFVPTLREEIIYSFKNGLLFDQLSRKTMTSVP